MARYLATTVRGLEDLAAADLRRGFGVDATADGPGAVRFDAGDELTSDPGVGRLVRRINDGARGIHRLGLLLAEGEVEAVEDCYGLARSVSYAETIGAEQPFAIRADRFGSHDFGSPDVAREVGQAVIDAFREATGRRLPVDLDEPEVIYRAQVVGRRFRLWLDTTGDTSLHHRSYRRGWHPAALKASIAYLLLCLAGWRGGGLVDPMCGSATIPIEAALAARGIPPARFHETPPAYRRLSWIDADAPPGPDGAAAPEYGDGGVGERDRGDGGSSGDEVGPFLGFERSTRHLQLAWENVAAAGVEGDVVVREGDALHLPDLLDGSADRPGLAVLNPPFGRRMGSVREIRELYRGFAEAGWDAGLERIVTLAERGDAMSEAAGRAGFRISHRREILHGALEAEILVADRPGTDLPEIGGGGAASAPPDVG